MSDFDFLEKKYPALYGLCMDVEKYKEHDRNSSLLKCRQAIEYIAKDLLEHPSDDLFDNINSLEDNGKITRQQADRLHRIRRVCNQGVHNEKISSEALDSCIRELKSVITWYVYTCKGEPLPEVHMSAVREQVPARPVNDVDPLWVGNVADADAFAPDDNPLKQSVFETDEEYRNRIAAMPSIVIGTGIVEPEHIDPYTGIAFLKYHLSHREEIEDVSIDAFCGMLTDAQRGQIYDGEIMSRLMVVDGKVYYDFQRLSLKSMNNEIPLYVIAWHSFPYESEDDFVARRQKLPLLPIGIVRPITKEYNIKLHLLPLRLTVYRYMENVIDSHTVQCIIGRDDAMRLCGTQKTIYLYGRLKSGMKKALEYRIWYDGMEAESSSVDDKCLEIFDDEELNKLDKEKILEFLGQESTIHEPLNVQRIFDLKKAIKKAELLNNYKGHTDKGNEYDWFDSSDSEEYGKSPLLFDMFWETPRPVPDPWFFYIWLLQVIEDASTVKYARDFYGRFLQNLEGFSGKMMAEFLYGGEDQIFLENRKKLLEIIEQIFSKDDYKRGELAFRPFMSHERMIRLFESAFRDSDPLKNRLYKIEQPYYDYIRTQNQQKKEEHSDKKTSSVARKEPNRHNSKESKSRKGVGCASILMFIIALSAWLLLK